jgi:hypothetical protein
MKTNHCFFLLKTPIGNITLIEGPMQPSETPGKVWVTAPAGNKLFEVPVSSVTEQTKMQAAQTLLDDERQHRERN